jgi:hypothetical protein
MNDSNSRPLSQLSGRELAKSVVLAIAGAVWFGLLVLVANWGHAPSQILLSVVTQVLMCFAMTFTSASLMQIVFKWPERPLMKFLAASAGVGGFSLLLMTLLHWAVGTPELFRTIGLATAVSFFYYVAFPFHLLVAYFEELDKGYRNQEDWQRQWGLRWFASPYDSKEYLGTVWRNIVGPQDKHRELTPYIENRFCVAASRDAAATTCIGFLGDIMPMKGKRWIVSDEVKNLFSDIDYLVVNFEGSLGEGPYSLFCQQHDEGIVNDMASVFPPHKTIVSVANNHSADFDYQEFIKTCALLRKAGFLVVGSRDHPSIQLANNINLVACTQWTNQSHGYLPFLENASSFTQSGQLNILYPHWGYEMELFPRQEWRELAKNQLNDFDVVVGHHSHVPGPVHLFSDDQGNSKLVAFSLGDSATGMGYGFYQQGIVLKLNFQTKDNEAKCTEGEWRKTRLTQTKEQAVLCLV